MPMTAPVPSSHATLSAEMSAPPFGRMLKESRAALRISQLELSLRANVSARHISFLETGRSRPTRAMVLQLARALDIPLRDQNLMLSAAGFTGRYRQSALGAPEMTHVKRALDLMLEKHEPWPALVFDSHWMMVQINRGGAAMFGALFGEQAAAMSGSPVNFLEMLLYSPDLRRAIENWEETVAHSIARIRREVDAGGAPDNVAAILQQAEADPAVQMAMASSAEDDSGAPLLPVIMNAGDVRLSFFSTITTFGTPQDITAQELRIEHFFPMDGETEDWFAKAGLATGQAG